MNAPVTTQVPVERKGISYAQVGMDQMGAGGMLAPKSLGDVVAFAQVMARADIALPKHLRGNDGACLSVAMQAMRWEMDPFAVANKSYAVNDRLAYEAQLCAAVVNTRAPIIGRPSYEYSGAGPTRRCKVTCTMTDGEVREYESPEFGQILTKNSPLWKSDPDQQLGYFAIRSWARRHTPEVLLGVYTPDEVATFQDIDAKDVTPGGTGMRARLEARRAGTEPSGGFDAAQVHSTLEAGKPNVDHIADAEVEDLAPPLDEALEGDDLPPGLRSAAEPDAAQDGKAEAYPILQWADDLESTLLDYVAVDPLREDWTARKAELAVADPERFKSLNAAVAKRAQDIGGGQ